MPLSPQRDTVARCTVCQSVFEVPVHPGAPPTVCSELCKRSRDAATARERRYTAALAADGRRYRALMAVVEDMSRGLLPLTEQRN